MDDNLMMIELLNDNLAQNGTNKPAVNSIIRQRPMIKRKLDVNSTEPIKIHVNTNKSPKKVKCSPDQWQTHSLKHSNDIKLFKGNINEKRLFQSYLTSKIADNGKSRKWQRDLNVSYAERKENNAVDDDVPDKWVIRAMENEKQIMTPFLVLINQRKEALHSVELTKDKLEAMVDLKEFILFKPPNTSIDDAIEQLPPDLQQKILSAFDVEIWLEFYKKYLIEILKNWFKRNDWVNFSTMDLLCHIDMCFRYAVDNTVEITCSLKMLKTIFDNRIDVSNTAQPSHVYNHSYLAMQLNLPYFKVIRMIHCTDVFIISKNLKSIERVSESTAFRTELNDKINNKVTKEIIWSYVGQLLKHIMGMRSEISFESRMRLITVLNQFKADLNPLHSYLKLSTRYYGYLSEYPYVRSVAEYQTPSESVHLFQLSRPILSFLIESGNHQNELFMHKFDDLIEFRCQLCDVYLGSIFSHTINEHLAEYHGSEDDRSCLNCGRTFTMTDLSKQRWRHICM